VELLRGSQGLGSGASVSSSGEIQAVTRLLRESGREDPNIFDVGANRGEYTEALRKQFPNGNYFLFEPSPETYSLLKTRLGQTQIKTFNIGLSDKSGVATLYKADLYSRIGSLTELPMSQSEFTEEVTLERLDDLFKSLEIQAIDLLKIDVEGHELHVLKGCSTILEQKRVGMIQFEFGEFNIYTGVFLKELFDFLHDYDFEISLIKFGRLVPLSNYSPRLEIFAPTNFIAKLN
jgi:FkbM family methyltransferase